MTRPSAATAFALASFVSLVPLATLVACAPAGSGESTSRLFERHCAGCHASDGRGVPGRRGLEPRLDLARSKMIARGDRGLLYQRIAFGYGTMPGFAHKLSQSELDDLVAYVQRFADPPTER